MKIVQALRLTGLFVVLCILLGEIENEYVAACGFGSGWACGTPHSCELWKVMMPT